MAIFSLAMLCTSSAYESEINKLSATMAEKIAGANKGKIAVVDFTDLQGNVTELGRFIAEEFSVALAGAGKGFKVVDRTHLKSIIRENKLSATGMIDPETARKLGKIAGVEALVTGTMTPFGDSVRISVKILDTATAEVIEANRGNIAKTQAIEELLARGIATQTTGGKAKSKKRTGAVIATSEVKGFTFELKECKRSGKNLACHVIVTSNEQDKKLGIYSNHGGRTLIYDDLGYEYVAKKVRVGSFENSSSVKRRFVAGVPTTVVFTFENVNSEAKVITLFEVGCYLKERFQVHFRNIPISK